MLITPHPPSAARRRGRPSRQRGAATTAGGAAPPPTARSRADAHPREREIVAFAKVWVPYGGGSDADIFVTFGLTPEQYFIRLATFLGSPPAGELTSAQRRTIRKACDQTPRAHPEPDQPQQLLAVGLDRAPLTHAPHRNCAYARRLRVY